MNYIALTKFLEPFQPFFAMENVNEICINRPGEVWVEQASQFVRYDVPILTEQYLWQFARLVAEFNQREISPETPTLSSTLPNGLRIQLVVPPACERGSFVCSIRQKQVTQLPLDSYFNVHANDRIQQVTNESKTDLTQSDLLQAYFNKDYQRFLTLAVQQKKNIIISGGTSTGKTTFLNSLLELVPLHERLITIETDREVASAHPNAVHLLAAQEGKSVADISMLGLLKATLRLRPDRILVSELRAEEAFPYLRAVNSGHPGSLTTIHADSPEGCFEQLAMMVIQSGSQLSRADIIQFAKSIIDIVVQIKRTPEGARYIDAIYFNDALSGLHANSRSIKNKVVSF